MRLVAFRKRLQEMKIKRREQMKKFYSWYKKHITAAIFTGLILGIITGLFLANRFEPVLAITSLIGSIYMNALNMMIFPLVFCSIIPPLILQKIRRLRNATSRINTAFFVTYKQITPHRIWYNRVD